MPMLAVNKLIPGGRGLAPVLVKRAAQVELDWDLRQKSRFEATDSLGRVLGVFLPRGTTARGGDVLVAEDGSLVRMLAAPQPVLVVRACAEHGTPFDLLRAAYHLGNRHVALELKPDHLKLEPDHVLADMLRQQHLIVSEAMEAFEPEGGAYGAAGHGHGHGHGHGSSHQHEHEQGHGQGHGHDPAHADPHASAVTAPVASTGAVSPATGHRHTLAVPLVAAAPAHVHGPGCGHDHGHDHGPAHRPDHDQPDGH